MNKTERKMTELLVKGKEAYGVVSVKAEFEAEGTRMDELLRLVDIARTAGLPLTVKIGGCEAIRDLLEAKQIGVRYIVAPMVETPYALSKYIAAKNMVFDEDEQRRHGLPVQHGDRHRASSTVQEVADIAARPGGANGIVFGRVDFVGSLGRHRDSINDPDDHRAGPRGRRAVPGAGPRPRRGRRRVDRCDPRTTRGRGRAPDPIRDAQGRVRRLRPRTLPDLDKGLLNAVHFELLWLQNKRDYYGHITGEDAKRIDMLESRWQVLNSEVR